MADIAITTLVNLPNDEVVSKYNANFGYVAKTADYTVTLLDVTIDCSGTFTVTLPTAVGISGRIFNINNSGTGVITVEGNGSETIDDELTQELASDEAIPVQSDGANWIIPY